MGGVSKSPGDRRSIEDRAIVSTAWFGGLLPVARGARCCAKGGRSENPMVFALLLQEGG